MGVITTEHLDDSELTEEELAYWTVHVCESLGNDYLKRLRELQESGCYPRDEEGWERLKAHAWQETIENNEVCKTISAISAQRRGERAAQEGVWGHPEPLSDDELAAEALEQAEPAALEHLIPVSAEVHALRARAAALGH